MIAYLLKSLAKKHLLIYKFHSMNNNFSKLKLIFNYLYKKD